LGKLQAHGIVRGQWLDYGCADGGYTIGLAERGAAHVTGVDVLPERIAVGRERAMGRQDVGFLVVDEGESLPFPDGVFDGVLLNEVLEHVADERQTLGEIHRVLRRGGHLAVFSPNRWFPFEGHGLVIGHRSLAFPVPWIPWLPKSLTNPHVLARNYWPGELRSMVMRSGFLIDAQASAFPVLEVYPWLPARAIRAFRQLVPYLERVPLIRRFGVSTFVLARRQ
jgi:SAM-dependent methyltransferase